MGSKEDIKEVDTYLKVASRGLVAHLQELYKDWEGSRQFQDTEGRVERLYNELCWSPSKIEEELKKCLKTFEDGYSEMLVTGPTEVWTLCPHHLLPCKFRTWIGYIPKDRVLGLSKFSRIAIIMGKRPIMQEEYSQELADWLNANLKPNGVAVYVEGTHGCMQARGIKQNSEVVTSVLKGDFLKMSEVRAEFYSISRRKI
jgi:GTP cyclohydrolase I